MRRELNRDKNLPSFSLTVGDLELLWNRVSGLFGDGEVYRRITVELSSERLEFEDIEELKNYTHLPDEITNFSLSFSLLRGENKGVRVSQRGVLSNLSYVTAYADNEAWCAGAIETVYSLVNSNRVWYSWFNTAPIGYILWFLFLIPSIFPALMPDDHKYGSVVWLGWLVTVSTIGFLYVFKNKLLPSSVLKIRERNSFIRRNTSELSLILALSSLLTTILGLYLSSG
ncbi:TPA: hypothetical protein ACGF6P_003471, partial [Vibrio cholerae]